MSLTPIPFLMKLQRRFNRKVGDKVYDKWVVVVPPETVRDLKWIANQELESRTEGRSLVLRPARKARTSGV